MASLLLFDHYLEHRRPRQLLLSAGFYVLAMLTYEIAWPFFLFPYLLFKLRYAGAQPTQVRGRALYPFLVLAGSFVAVFVIRSSTIPPALLWGRTLPIWPSKPLPQFL
ncbi:MAG: hypothetical protein E6K70_06090 [Planctomycetota bacterium]|nr:MAG: hypothetical protein E6K70_06090 [Planctomycetota bacterium]